MIWRREAVAGADRQRTEMSVPAKRRKRTVKASQASELTIRRTRNKERRDKRPVNKRLPDNKASAPLKQINKVKGSSRARPRRDKVARVNRRKQAKADEATARHAMVRNEAAHVMADKTSTEEAMTAEAMAAEHGILIGF